MLELRNIVKDYSTGGSTVRALRGISLQFRKHEFVSILGPSGCGKTTLLNIIGGLDQYTSGDLIINGVSTKKYRDADWDTYRNHSIGFVFQSYNLIPHQTVLSNVELALTLSGIPKRERRARAVTALRQVGLGAQLHKKPNQMSGGQMQRVAIARALVNDPDILLADEPTGALDTQTSIQIMEILKKISRKRLIIMVTHNPDLAMKYSSRIIRVLDGKVVGDSNPFSGQKVLLPRKKKTTVSAPKRKNPFSVQPKDAEELQLGGSGYPSSSPRKGKKSMSFLTALSLSLNNLMTKKGRTFMTSFAGSIGIIGIALILSVSTGVNAYINSVQRDTLASYPITLQAESVDMTALIQTMMNPGGEKKEHDLDKVYESAIMADLMNSLASAETNVNDLKTFKKFLETSGKFDKYLTAVQYTYDFGWNILTKDTEGKVLKSDVNELFNAIYGTSSDSPFSPSGSSSSSAMTSMSSGYKIWQEMLRGSGDELVSDTIKSEYDLIYGSWPQKYNEVVLLVDQNNEVSDLALYALGLRTEDEILEGLKKLTGEAEKETDSSAATAKEQKSWTYEELCRMSYRLLLRSECYQKQGGVYGDMTKTELGLDYLYNNNAIGTELKVVGILRPNADATSTILTGTIGYTAALTDYAIEKTAKSDLLKEQLQTPETDVLTSLPFRTEEDKELTNAEKKAAVDEYLAGLGTIEKASIGTQILSIPTSEATAAAVEQMMAETTDLTSLIVQAMVQQYNFDEATARSYVDSMTEEKKAELATAIFTAQFVLQYKMRMEAQLSVKTAEEICAMLDAALSEMSDTDYATIHDTFLPKQYSDSTYEENLKLLGNVEKDSPSEIRLYSATFEDKDMVADLIEKYNQTVSEKQQISYTDYVALLMSSVTTIVNAITYVLIAFVAISLVVSSIMIGIITYISVLERTKEIGILRAIGASKKDVSRVFNAETLIVGFVAGMIGILITLGLNVIINLILFRLTGIAALHATLPVGGAIALVLISMALTFIAGLFPSGFAAKRNPVEALRSE